MEKQAAYIAKLIGKSKLGQLTDVEATHLQAWLAAGEHNRQLYAELQNEAVQREAMRMMYAFREEGIRIRILTSPQESLIKTASSSIQRLHRWLPYAAAVIIALSVGLFFWDSGSNTNDRVVERAATDLPPGSNRATLTLADGRTISLSETQIGIVVTDGITYLDGSSVFKEQGSKEIGKRGHDEPRLDKARSENHSSPRSLILTTPKGGTYQITLPDGTQVWLNAASTLKYPGRFDGDERVVEVIGEAYFSVKHDAKRLFKVVSNDQEVQVLGTEFNISAYLDDQAVKTTLVEGKVRLSLASDKSLVLTPGQQATVRGSSFEVGKVDIFDYTAWRNGIIVLNGARLPDVIRQLERWYNVAIELPELETNKTAYVMINRNENLSSVLKALEETYHVKLKLEGRRVSVIN